MASSTRPFDDGYECTLCKARESDVGYAPHWCRHYCARCEVKLLRSYEAQRAAGRKRRTLQAGTRFYLNYLLREKLLPRPLLQNVFEFLS